MRPAIEKQWKNSEERTLKIWVMKFGSCHLLSAMHQNASKRLRCFLPSTIMQALYQLCFLCTALVAENVCTVHIIALAFGPHSLHAEVQPPHDS